MRRLATIAYLAVLTAPILTQSTLARADLEPPIVHALVACGTVSDEFDVVGQNGTSSGQSSEESAIDAALSALAAKYGECGDCVEAPPCSQVNIWSGVFEGTTYQAPSGWTAFASGSSGATLTIACRRCP